MLKRRSAYIYYLHAFASAAVSWGLPVCYCRARGVMERARHFLITAGSN